MGSSAFVFFLELGSHCVAQVVSDSLISCLSLLQVWDYRNVLSHARDTCTVLNSSITHVGQSSLPFFSWSQPPFTDLSHSLSFSYKTECRLQTLPSCPSSWLSFLLQPCAMIWHLHSHGPVPCLSQPWRTQSSAFPITISRLLESTGKSTNRANWYHPRFMVPDFSLASGPQWSASVLNLLPLQLPGGPLSHL